MKKYVSLFVIVLCLPLIVWYVCGIFPTFDDFTSLQSPWWMQIADPGYFQPDTFRRPFDFLFGCLLGWCPALFPTLNHVVIILGHTANAVLVFALCRRLRLGVTATHIATLFFFFSPATLGATLACDGLNQTFAQFWGLMALWTYAPCSAPLGARSSSPAPLGAKGSLWLLCVAMAVLSKENGLAWAVVPPVFAYAFGQTPLRQAARDACKGILLAVAYFVILYLLIHSGIAGIEYPDEYSEATLTSHLKDLAQLMAYTWVPLDYMSAVYAPSRDLAIVVITALTALPFLAILALRWWRKDAKVRTQMNCRVLLLVLCFFILVSPHLITVVSIMHNYAALSIAAIVVAVLLSLPSSDGNGQARFPTTKHASYAFALFLAAALFTDVHHYIAARESGLLGKRLAMQAIETAGHPLQKAMVISIDDPEEPRYSSFCVRPADAFGWGLAVRHYTDYTWNTAISEATFHHYDPGQVKAVADSALRAGNEAVWVVGHKADSLTVIRN